MIDLPLFVDSLPALFQGALLSLQLASLAVILGLTFGTVLAFMEGSNSRVARIFAFLFTNFFRGTPMLVQILFLFYVLPQLGIAIASLWTMVLAQGMNSSAYLSQVIRTGLNAMPKGQILAAKTLGMTRWQTQRHVVLPWTFKTLLPSLTNEMITLIKDTSLASVIGIVELTKAGSIIRGRTYDAFTILLAVSLIYLTITFSWSLMAKYLEKRSQRPCSW